MKTAQEIKQLLHLFYEGEATQAQENELKAYFAQANVADNLKDDQQIFNAIYNTDESEIPIPDDLEQKITQTINQLETNSLPKPVKKHVLNKLLIAASVALMLGFGLFLLNNKTNTPTLSQADKADLIKAQQALILLSENYNKGLQELNQTQEEFTQSGKKLHKSLNVKNY